MGKASEVPRNMSGFLGVFHNVSIGVFQFRSTSLVLCQIWDGLSWCAMEALGKLARRILGDAAVACSC
jgi:hypothetical protein